VLVWIDSVVLQTPIVRDRALYLVAIVVGIRPTSDDDDDDDDDDAMAGRNADTAAGGPHRTTRFETTIDFWRRKGNIRSRTIGQDGIRMLLLLFPVCRTILGGSVIQLYVVSQEI